MHEDERYENGLSVRKAVLGDAHVERSLAKRNDFNTEFQALITRYAWGEIWTRPGLPRHTRSLLTIGRRYMRPCSRRLHGLWLPKACRTPCPARET